MMQFMPSELLDCDTPKDFDLTKCSNDRLSLGYFAKVCLNYPDELHELL